MILNLLLYIYIYIYVQTNKLKKIFLLKCMVRIIYDYCISLCWFSLYNKIKFIVKHLCSEIWKINFIIFCVSRVNQKFLFFLIYFMKIWHDKRAIKTFA